MCGSDLVASAYGRRNGALGRVDPQLKLLDRLQQSLDEVVSSLQVGFRSYDLVNRKVAYPVRIREVLLHCFHAKQVHQGMDQASCENREQRWGQLAALLDPCCRLNLRIAAL